MTINYFLEPRLMTSVQTTATAPSRSLEGIACVIIGMLLFVGQDGMMKFMLEIFPIWALMGVRGLIALVVLTSLILWLGAPHRLFTPLWRLHVLRGVLLGFGFSLFYAAFPFMNLAEVSTIFFSAPLMIGLLSVVMLGETIGKHRIELADQRRQVTLALRHGQTAGRKSDTGQ